MSSSKALRTVSPPKPASNTPIVGRRRTFAPRSALMHLVPSELTDGVYRFSLGNSFSPAARSGRNRRPVRTGTRMAEERADLIGRFGRKNVLKLAGLLLDLRLAVHCQAVSKQALGQQMPPDNAARSIAPTWREFHNQRPIAQRCSHRFQGLVARIHEWLVIMRLGRMGRGRQHPPP